MLHKHRKFSLIALIEPFQESRYIQRYKRRLGMQSATYNHSREIWVFTSEGFSVELLLDTTQQISMKLGLNNNDLVFVATIVYAKCNALERLDLWEDIYRLANNMHLFWLVGGDFNVIMNEEEKRVVCLFFLLNMKILPSV